MWVEGIWVCFGLFLFFVESDSAPRDPALTRDQNAPGSPVLLLGYGCSRPVDQFFQDHHHVLAGLRPAGGPALRFWRERDERLTTPYGSRHYAAYDTARCTAPLRCTRRAAGVGGLAGGLHQADEGCDDPIELIQHILRGPTDEFHGLGGLHAREDFAS